MRTANAVGTIICTAIALLVIFVHVSLNHRCREAGGIYLSREFTCIAAEEIRP